LPGFIPERIGPIDRADDAAGDRKLKLAERVADSQNGLSGNQLGRVTPGDCGQVFGVDLDHCQICKLVGANYLGWEGPAVMQGDTYFHCSLDHVIVGHDVTIGGDDHAAANAMLNLPLAAASHAGHALALPLPLTEAWSEKLRERIIPTTLALALHGRLLRPMRGDSNVDHSRCNARSHRFGCLVERQKGIDARIVDRRNRVIGSHCSMDVVVTEDERSSRDSESQSSDWRSEAPGPCS
jgi:hypothetical protein